MDRRPIIGFVAATFIPPLAAMQVIGTGDVLDPGYWLKIATILIGSFSAAGIYALTQLNRDAGYLPVQGGDGSGAANQ